jgi:CheY-like chemotaxis protein
MVRDDCPVLVVDDDPSLRDLMDWGLSDLGYRVATAPDGLAALEVVEKERPCLIFLDMRMPVLDGWGFAKRYREASGQQAPIVVVTAARDAAEWARQIDAVDYLAKPFDINALVEKTVRYFG